MWKGMIKSGCVLALCLLNATAAFGQGTVLFTWHGDSNLFQASFEVTSAEMQPGASWESSLFANSLTITNPLGFVYHGGDSSSVGSGGVYSDGSFWLTYTFVDFSRGTELHEGAGNGTGTIFEKPISGSITSFENGYWTYFVVPEPSAASLFVIGGGLWLIRKMRKGS
jgi:hypothetical protein